MVGAVISDIFTVALDVISKSPFPVEPSKENVYLSITTTCHSPFAAVLPIAPTRSTLSPVLNPCSTLVITSIGLVLLASNTSLSIDAGGSRP